MTLCPFFQPECGTVVVTGIIGAEVFSVYIIEADKKQDNFWFERKRRKVILKEIEVTEGGMSVYPGVIDPGLGISSCESPSQQVDPRSAFTEVGTCSCAASDGQYAQSVLYIRSGIGAAEA